MTDNSPPPSHACSHIQCLFGCVWCLESWCLHVTLAVLSSIKIKIWRWEVKQLVRPSDQSWSACTCLPTGGKWNTHRWRVLRSAPVPRSSTKHWVLSTMASYGEYLDSSVPKSSPKLWVLSTMASYREYFDPSSVPRSSTKHWVLKYQLDWKREVK